MSPAGGPVALRRLELRRLSPAELVLEDPLLRGCGLLRGLSSERASELLEQAVPRRYPDGGAVFREGDAAGPLFLVLRGEVRLSTARAGEALEFGGAAKGEVLGEVPRAPRPALRDHSAWAVGAVEVLELSAEAITSLARVHPPCCAFLEELGARRRKALDEMAEFLGRW